MIAGGVISFLANCGRVLTLTLLTHSSGQQAAAEWHDTVGGSATAATFALVLAVACLLSRGVAQRPIATPPAGLVRIPEGVAIFAIVLTIPLAAHAWFSGFENSAVPTGKVLRWTLSDTRLPAGWTSEYVAPAKTARTSLRFSEWQSYQLRSPDCANAQVIHLSWEPGTRIPSFVTNHTPAICMPASGWVQSAPAEVLTLTVRGTALPGVIYPFTRDGARMLVFQSMSAGGQIEQRFVDPTQIPGGFRRLATLWHAPLRQISEELLLYAPDPGDSTSRASAAAAILEAVLVDEGS
jgi:hypothetical protein